MGKPTSHVKDKIVMLYNPLVASNGSTRLRHVWRVDTKGENPFMQQNYITNPFDEDVFLERRDPVFVEAQQRLCTGMLPWTNPLIGASGA